MKRAKREIRRPKPHLGRVFRDVRRKLEGRPEVAAQFAEPLARVARLLAQQRTDKHKLYALHAPEVACIAKGKAHNRYEFGAKLSVAVTNREGLVVGMQTHPAIPTTARPWRPCSPRSNSSPGSPPERCYVDRGYRGHGVNGDTAIVVAGRRRGLTPTMKRELRRRSAIEAMIGHMKLDGKLARITSPARWAMPSMPCSAAPATTCACSCATWPGFFVPCSACSPRSRRSATPRSKRRKLDFFRAD